MIPAQTTEAAESVALAAELFAAMATGTRADHERLVHSQAGNREAVIEPLASRGTGPAAWWATTEWIRSAFSELRWEIHEAIAADDLVAVHVTMSGRHTGEHHRYGPDGAVAQTLPPTGRSFAVTQSHWFRIADGLLVDHWANRDDLGMGMQLGWFGPAD